MTKLLCEHDHMPSMMEPHMMDTFVRMSKDRTIFINEDITKNSATELTALLMYYDNLDKTKPITLFLNTNGGDALALSNIIDVMKMIHSPIKTICLARCFSAGALILAAGTKGMRYAMKNSKIMAHGLQIISPPGSDLVNYQNYYEFLKEHNKKIIKLLSNFTGQKISKVEEDLSKDHWMSSIEAKNYGLIDYIL